MKTAIITINQADNGDITGHIKYSGRSPDGIAIGKAYPLTDADTLLMAAEIMGQVEYDAGQDRLVGVGR